MTPTSHDTFAAFVGIDWADAKHDGCLQAAGSAKRECFQLEHTPEAIDAWVTTLRTRFHGHPVALCLELRRSRSLYRCASAGAYHSPSCAAPRELGTQRGNSRTPPRRMITPGEIFGGVSGILSDNQYR